MQALQLLNFLTEKFDPNLPLPFAGIGARKSPEDVCKVFSDVANLIQYNTDWMLRSGGADGADLAFEQGVDNATRKQIFLPWPGFNDNMSPFCHPSDDAFILAAKFHPRWQNISRSVKCLMARNCHQVFGQNLDTPAAFILCWTPDGASTTTTKETGGSGQSIRMANYCQIPVYNLNDPKFQRLLSAVSS